MHDTKAVLVDRDGTLIADVPGNSDPGLVQAMPGAREALGRLRNAGCRIGVVTNQPGIAEGWMTPAAMAQVHERVEILVGPIDDWFVCTHGAQDGCSCRKPQPGLILQAAEVFGVRPSECVVIGDVVSDIEAARRAGARALLVPTPQTRREEIAAAPAVALDLAAAADMILGM